eukprot:2616842-Prymnesium_polylepis.1
MLPVTVGDIMPDGFPMTCANPYDTDQFDMTKDSKQLSKADCSMQRCTASDGWGALRIGPFNTTGGYHWTEMITAITSPQLVWTPRMYEGKRVLPFHQYSVGSISNTGAILGHPPIHQGPTAGRCLPHLANTPPPQSHVQTAESGWVSEPRGSTTTYYYHYHFYSPSDHPTDTLNIHGEQQCHHDESGEDCYLKTLPEGYAYITGASLPRRFKPAPPELHSRRRLIDLASFGLHLARCRHALRDHGVHGRARRGRAAAAVVGARGGAVGARWRQRDSGEDGARRAAAAADVVVDQQTVVQRLGRRRLGNVGLGPARHVHRLPARAGGGRRVARDDPQQHA